MGLLNTISEIYLGHFLKYPLQDSDPREILIFLKDYLQDYSFSIWTSLQTLNILKTSDSQYEELDFSDNDFDKNESFSSKFKKSKEINEDCVSTHKNV